jgi:two-component system sensor histidine kinase MtrB
MTDSRAPRAPRSLRRRIALLFFAAVALTALALTLSAYFITSTAQESDAVDKAIDQTRFNLFLADSMLPADPSATAYDRLLDAYAIRGDFSTLIAAAGETYVSGPRVTIGLITPELAAKVAQGRIGYQMVTMNGEQTLAVGGSARQGGPALYFFYPQGERLAEQAQLRNILIAAGLILAVLGALAGYWVAGGLLRPVGRASRAAVTMARGDLDVRLPEGTDEFGVLGSSFNRMAENLQTKMYDLEAGQARERRFVADVAHELRTPVSALVGEASLLRGRTEADKGISPEVTRLTVLIERDIARLRQLVDDLLEISRLDARAVEAVIEPVDLVQFVGQLVRAHDWADRVEVSGREANVFAETDKRLIERIIVNLVQNALHHGAPPVAVEVRSVPVVFDAESVEHAQPALVQVAVTDGGPGVSGEHLPHIFDRFYKADPSRSFAGGSGLGLAIARENARLLGGDLVAQNLAGQGMRFVLTLPAAG